MSVFVQFGLANFRPFKICKGWIASGFRPRDDKKDFQPNWTIKYTSQEEIEERKSKFYNLLATWAFKAYLKDKGIEDMFEGLELPDGNIYAI